MLLVEVTQEHINDCVEGDAAYERCGCAIHSAIIDGLELDTNDRNLYDPSTDMLVVNLDYIAIDGVRHKCSKEVAQWQEDLGAYIDKEHDRWLADTADAECPEEIVLCFTEQDGEHIVYNYKGDI